MGLITATVPTVGAPRETEEADVTTALTALFGLVNGSIDAANIASAAGITGAQLAAAAGITGAQLAAATQAALGLNGASVRRGKSIIATEESRTNTAYGTLTTPDQVSGVVMPTDGLIFVTYRALWKNSVASAASAAIFLGANRVAAAESAGAPTYGNTGATGGASVGVYSGLVTAGAGLVGGASGTGDANVTTGQFVGVPVGTAVDGGATVIFAAAGTYDVSVRFLATSGTVTVKDRRLWVWSMGFD